MYQNEEIFDLTAFQRDILYTLARYSSLSGMEVHDNLSRVYNENFTQSRIYSNLDQMVAAGLVKKGSFSERTNKYELTEEGKEKIEDQIRWEQRCLENADFIDVVEHVTNS